jgi:hypothetical protein
MVVVVMVGIMVVVGIVVMVGIMVVVGFMVMVFAAAAAGVLSCSHPPFVVILSVIPA